MIRLVLAAGLALAIPFAASGQTPKTFFSWAHLKSVGASISPVSDDIDIGHVEGRRSWVVKDVVHHRRKDGPDLDKVRWADASSCPGLQTTLEKLSEMKGPRVQNLDPSKDGETHIEGDAGYWELEAPAIWDGYLTTLVFRSSGGGPLPEWDHELMKTAEPCWRDGAPG